MRLSYLGGESTPTNFALERALACVRPVVHLQSAFATEHPFAEKALIRVLQLVLNIVHQLLKFDSLRGLLNLHQGLPSAVSAAWFRKKGLVEDGVRLADRTISPASQFRTAILVTGLTVSYTGS